MEPKKDERSVRESSVIGQDSLSHLIILLSTFANLLKADKKYQSFFFQSVSLSSFGLEIRSGGALGWECREVMLREGEGIAFRRHAIKYPTTNPPLRDRQGGRGVLDGWGEGGLGRIWVSKQPAPSFCLSSPNLDTAATAIVCSVDLEC